MFAIALTAVLTLTPTMELPLSLTQILSLTLSLLQALVTAKQLPPNEFAGASFKDLYFVKKTNDSSGVFCIKTGGTAHQAGRGATFKGGQFKQIGGGQRLEKGPKT